AHGRSSVVRGGGGGGAARAAVSAVAADHPGGECDQARHRAEPGAGPGRGAGKRREWKVARGGDGRWCRAAAGPGRRHGAGQRARTAGAPLRRRSLAAPGTARRRRGGGMDRGAGGGTGGGAGMSRVTALVAEDEAPQRRALVEQLGQLWPELSLCAVCEDGVAALEAARAQRPQVAFLDIRMPGVGGLDVAREVVAHGGLVVFTTAYDDYAVHAFEAGAADYLLKPVQSERLAQAVARLRQRLEERRAGAAAPDLQALLEELEARLRPRGERLIRWITASVGDSVRMIGIDEVLFFQAQDKYVRVATATGDAVIRTPLKEIVAGLDPDVFWQVHRGAVVRVAAIDRLVRNELGRYGLRLRNHPETLPVSAPFLHRFRGM